MTASLYLLVALTMGLNSQYIATAKTTYSSRAECMAEAKKPHQERMYNIFIKADQP